MMIQLNYQSGSPPSARLEDVGGAEGETMSMTVSFYSEYHLYWSVEIIYWTAEYEEIQHRSVDDIQIFCLISAYIADMSRCQNKPQYRHILDRFT